MEVFNKFLIVDDKLFIQRCTYHYEILDRVKKYMTDEELIDGGKVSGGGWWEKKDETFILFGSSEDFGTATLDDIANCINSGKVYSSPLEPYSLTDRYKFKYINKDKNFIEL